MIEVFTQGEALWRVLLVVAAVIGGYFTVRYQRQLAIQGAQNRKAELQDDIIALMGARIEEGKAALVEHERTQTEYRLQTIRLEACERERTALTKIVEEWDHWIGRVWLDQSRIAQSGDRDRDQVDSSQPNGDG